MRELGRLHFGFNNLQSDSSVAQVLMIQQLRAMAYGEATLSQLRAGFILQALWIAHQLWRRVGVDRRGRHLVVGVEMDAGCDEAANMKVVFVWVRGRC